MISHYVCIQATAGGRKEGEDHRSSSRLARIAAVAYDIV